ncbi:hypothetical protein [Kocuria sp. SM24M-10]|uniref:hypothetical protein n=1 Tax=Kocuria sp. SM24M-10 TaxID=1660349 RepID=UPI000A4D1B1F|nr:hypothetical protein [Kocuria sp. SM24M-10]
MGFKVFDKRMTPLAKAPSVTIQKRGVISLNKAAHHLVNNAETVELLHDRERQVMALRAADDSSPHTHAVRNSSKRGPGQAIVSATAFTAHTGSTPPLQGGGSLLWRTPCSAWIYPHKVRLSPVTAPRARHW